MKKDKALAKIALEIENCKTCRQGKVGVAVPGEGNSDASILFVGEAPGKNESISGRPFIGRSGKLLRALINEIGLLEKDVYITSPVKYLPIYKTPTEEDIKHGMKHFKKQIEVINPDIMVLLGSVAARGVLGEKLSVADNHGRVIERNGRKYLLTYHPAAALRFPNKFKSLLKEDFKKIRSLI